MNNLGKSSEWYKYLGKTNTGEWKLEDFLKNRNPEKMTDLMISRISQILSPFTKGIKNNPVKFKPIKSAVNSRFGHCWFLDNESSFSKKIEDEYDDPVFLHRYFSNEWDICIQPFDDEWFLINMGDGRGYFNYWYVCDTLDGFEHFIKDMFADHL